MTAITPTDFRVVADFLPTPLTVKTGEALVKSQYCRVDGTTGKAMLGNASAAGEVGGLNGFAMTTPKQVGSTISLFRYGLLDWGTGLDDFDYGASVFLADVDSTYATTAGTVSTVVGKIFPVWEDDGTVKKLLLVDLR